MKIKQELKKQKYLVLLGLIFFAVFFIVFPTQATGGNFITWLISGIAQVFVSVLGFILTKIMGILIYISQYNKFIDSDVVVVGWVIVRDICNMFFVIILMIIAFATILKLENYSYKKWLPKLILMAILINFSKTICGIIIDAAQIVMLTFVNAFKDIGGGNLVDLLGITNWQSLKGVEEVNNWEIAAAYILAVIYAAVSLIVVTAMVAMLVMRIIMIWIYVVLSPLAYLMSAFPGGAKYASSWWSEFIKNLIVGPVLAFFIWLSFTSLANFQTNELGITGTPDNREDLSCELDSKGVCKYGTSDLLLKFIIAIGMLLGGLKIASEIGGEAAKVAGKVADKGKSWGIASAKGLGALAALPANYGVDKLQEYGHVDLNVKRAWATMQARRKAKKEDQYTRGLVNAGINMDKGGIRGVLAMTAGPSDAWDRLSDWKGLKPVGIIKQLRGGKGMEEAKERAIIEQKTAQASLDEAKFKDQFINGREDERITMAAEMEAKEQAAQASVQADNDKIESIKKRIKLENSRKNYKDDGLIANLNKELSVVEENKKKNQDDVILFSNRRKYAEKNLSRKFKNAEIYSAREEIKSSQTRIESAEKKISDNTPKYNRQARLAEQAAVQKKEGELKGIDDPTELLRMLKGAIATHDKNMVKAVMIKMTKDGNDNEALEALVGRTDHLGLKDLMRQLSDKNSKNYAGFHEQEAFGLGSQVAEMNKATNHWAATSAYLMENGKWRETTEKEHNDIRNTETGKQQLQAFIRNNNRLAYGYHDSTGEFHLDAGGVIKLEAIDSVAGHKNIETMNESSAKYVYAAIMKNDKLRERFSQVNAEDNKSLIKALESRLGGLTKGGDISMRVANAKALLSS